MTGGELIGRRGGTVPVWPGAAAVSSRGPARPAERPPTARWVPPPSTAVLREAVAAAAAATTAGDRKAATRVLAGLLTSVDPGIAGRSTTLVGAAAWWAWLASREHSPARPPAAMVAWARYALDGLTELRGPTHPGTRRAGYALGTLLRRSGDPSGAAAVYGQVVTGLTRARLWDQADLVSAQQHAAAHAAGHCRPAIEALATVWQRWRRWEPAVQQPGLPILVRLVAMGAACGLRDHTAAWWREADTIINAGPDASRPESRLLATVVITDTLHAHLSVCQIGRGPDRFDRRPGPVLAPVGSGDSSLAGRRP